MTKKDTIKKNILKEVGAFHRADGKKAFRPGIDPVPYAGRVFDEKELINAVDASLDFWLTEGRFVRDFNAKLAAFIGAKFCIPVNSGSSANLLAVSALMSPLLKDRRLKPGDEVITTACGFPTTINPIIQNGLVPVFLDVELGTYNILTDQIEKAITKKTKAIFTAHTLGNPIHMDIVGRLARKYGLWWIEDNCDALGSTYRGRRTGSFGHMSTSSFYPPHHITMGEGGAVLTSDPLLRKIVLSLRDWGRDCSCPTGQDNICGKRFTQKFGDLPLGYDHKYVYSHIGYNLKITDIQAAIGCAQLEKIDGFVQARRKNFSFLEEALRPFAKFLHLPRAERHADPSWFGFPILVDAKAPFTRAEIIDHLEKNRIATRMLFGGNLVKQPAYRGMAHRISGNLKNTDLVMDRLFWVGVYPGLSREQLAFMAKTFNDFLTEKTRG